MTLSAFRLWVIGITGRPTLRSPGLVMSHMWHGEKTAQGIALRRLLVQAKGTTKSTTDRLKQEMEKSLRHFVELPIDDELIEFAADKEAIRGAYPADKAIKCLPEVNKCVANAKAGAEVLGVFANNLKAIVNEAMEPLSD